MPGPWAGAAWSEVTLIPPLRGHLPPIRGKARAKPSTHRGEGGTRSVTDEGDQRAAIRCARRISHRVGRRGRCPHRPVRWCVRYRGPLGTAAPTAGFHGPPPYPVCHCVTFALDRGNRPLSGEATRVCAFGSPERGAGRRRRTEGFSHLTPAPQTATTYWHR